jgi:Ca2+-binding RTX toxin-like protein
LTGGTQADTLDAGAGADTLYAKDGVRDQVWGGADRDTAIVDRGRDRVVAVETVR